MPQAQTRAYAEADNRYKGACTTPRLLRACNDISFSALYQGIPDGGYTAMVEKMLEGIEVRLNVDYLADRENLNALADKVVYTGPVDAYFGYRLGALQYRSVRFETETLDTDNYQGNAVFWNGNNSTFIFAYLLAA